MRPSCPYPVSYGGNPWGNRGAGEATKPVRECFWEELRVFSRGPSLFLAPFSRFLFSQGSLGQREVTRRRIPNMNIRGKAWGGEGRRKGLWMSSASVNRCDTKTIRRYRGRRRTPMSFPVAIVEGAQLEETWHSACACCDCRLLWRDRESWRWQLPKRPFDFVDMERRSFVREYKLYAATAEITEGRRRRRNVCLIVRQFITYIYYACLNLLIVFISYTLTVFRTKINPH